VGPKAELDAVEKRKFLTQSGIELREMQKTATDDSAHILKKVLM
jgi:hypothetical protein